MKKQQYDIKIQLCNNEYPRAIWFDQEGNRGCRNWA